MDGKLTSSILRLLCFHSQSRVGPSDVAQTRLGGDQAPPLNHQMSASATATGGLSGPRPPQRPPTKPLPAVPAGTSGG